jgi:hypothetical protein
MRLLTMELRSREKIENCHKDTKSQRMKSKTYQMSSVPLWLCGQFFHGFYLGPRHGTSRFNSSAQCCTITMCRGGAVHSLIIRNRRPSEVTSNWRPQIPRAKEVGAVEELRRRSGGPTDSLRGDRNCHHRAVGCRVEQLITLRIPEWVRAAGSRHLPHAITDVGKFSFSMAPQRRPVFVQ